MKRHFTGHPRSDSSGLARMAERGRLGAGATDDR